MPLEPDVVDLRSQATEEDRKRENATAPPPASSGRSAILGGVALVAFGVLLGWMLSAPDDASVPEPEARSERVVPVPDLNQPAPTREVQETSLAPEPLAPELLAPESTIAESALSERDRVFEAGVTPLAQADELAGPITLVPGLEEPVTVRLEPDGTVTVMVPQPRAAEPEDAPSPPYIGFPLAPVADGLLIAPIAGSLGAVAYWRPQIGVSLPLPDEVTTVSYLAASGDLGIFLSAGEVVVHDLARSVDVLRVDAHVDGAQVIQACVNPDRTALALVGRSGKSLVIDMASGATTTEFFTGTPLRGVAWSGPDQMVFLVGSDSAQLVRALDTSSGVTRDVARLNAGSNWKMSTEGPGC